MIYPSQEFAETLKEIITSDYRHSLYDITVAHAEAMSVHVYGDKPVYLLNRARPREDEEVKLYRVENYEPTTKAGADKAIDITSKIFNPTISSIRWKEKSEQQKILEEYTMYYFMTYNSIINYNKDVTLRKMIADPNAVQAVKPGVLPEDETERLEPEVIIYGSSNVWNYDRDHFLFFIRKEEGEKQDRFYFDYYDKKQVAHLEAWYEASSKEVVINIVGKPYIHGWNEIPAWFLRGKSKSMGNGQILYESWFSSALPHWNLAIIHESDLLGAFIAHLHPQKYEMTEDCGFQYPYEGQMYPCRGGVITYGDSRAAATQNKLECPSCGGSGRQAVKSPYGTYQINSDKLNELPGGQLPVGYVTIPTEATEMLVRRCESMVQKGMWSINMDIEEKVGEAQSGKAKIIDRSAQHDFLFTIGSVVFDVLLPNQYYFINKYMFKEQQASVGRKEENKNLPEINKPTNFDIVSSAELVNNFKVAKESGLDRNFLRTREIEILSRDLSTNPDLKKYQITMLELDPLPGFTLEEIDLGTSRGMLKKTDAVIHLNLKPFMDRALQDHKDFMTKENKQDQLAIFEGYAKELIVSEKPKIDSSMIIKDDDQQQAA